MAARKGGLKLFKLNYVTIVFFAGWVFTTSLAFLCHFMVPNSSSEMDDDRPKTAKESSSTSRKNKSKMHIVFSTSCSIKQDWQAYMFFHQAMVQKQPGSVTRIVSGCNPEEEATMTAIHEERTRIMNENFHIHFTPQFGKVEGRHWEKTKYWNKPFGMKHWLENKLGYRYEGEISTAFDDHIIVLVDPDMLLLRPFLNDFRSFPDSIWIPYHAERSGSLYRRVSQGKPMAQLYGFYDSWLRRAKKNLTHVVGPDSPVHKVTKVEAANIYHAGPPYVLTARDMYRVVHHWTRILPRLSDVDDTFMIEMYGYCLAAAHLQLKHQVAGGFMVSDISIGAKQEGWGFLKGKPDDVCRISQFKETVPHVLHYCHRYGIGEYFWNKYLLPEDILSCEHPLFEPLPLDIALTTNYSHYGDGTTQVWEGSDEKKYRTTFMICSLIESFNQGLSFFKDHHCPQGANYNKSWTHHKHHKSN